MMDTLEIQHDIAHLPTPMLSIFHLSFRYIGQASHLMPLHRVMSGPYHRAAFTDRKLGKYDVLETGCVCP